MEASSTKRRVPRRSRAGLTELGRYHSAGDRNVFLIVLDANTSVAETAAMMEGRFGDPELAQHKHPAATISLRKVQRLRTMSTQKEDRHEGVTDALWALDHPFSQRRRYRV